MKFRFVDKVPLIRTLAVRALSQFVNDSENSDILDLFLEVLPLEQNSIRFIDNTDPAGIDHQIAQLGPELASTLVIVISKSGGTPETRMAYWKYRKPSVKLVWILQNRGSGRGSHLLALVEWWETTITYSAGHAKCTTVT